MRIYVCAFRGRSIGEWHSHTHSQQLEIGSHITTNTITGIAKDNYLFIDYEL